MRSRTQLDLNEAVEDTRSAMERITQANRDLQGEIATLREMHSRLAWLNVERQKTIAALADALVLARKGLVQSGELPDEAWTQIDSALKLAEREPETQEAPC